MQRSLSLLILMGLCYFITGQLYEFHVIKEKKTWDEAQKYCREKHTDLASVKNMQDNQWLSSSAGTVQEAWIGLKNVTQGNKRWYWSLPGLKYKEQTKWSHGEPSDHNGTENCAFINLNKNLSDLNCQYSMNFICYNETKEGDERFKCIDTKMDWLHAQDYCRENHTDLLSGHEQLEALSEDVFKGCPDPNTFWIGLFRDRWRWSDNSTSSFRNWDLEFKDEEGKECAMVVKENGKKGKWRAAGCRETKPFICYQEKLILITLNRTWTDALYYCRKHHHDLVSIRSQADQLWVQEKAKKANSPFLWLGMHYTCTLDFWFWVSDEKISYENSFVDYWPGTVTWIYFGYLATGIFTAPLKGVYHFSFMTFGYSSHTSGAILVKNGHYQVSTWEFKGADTSDTTSNTVVLQLKPGETVNIILLSVRGTLEPTTSGHSINCNV